MGYKVLVEITQPVHGPGGELLHEPGERHDPSLRPDLAAAGRLVVVEVEDEPERGREPEREREDVEVSVRTGRRGR